MKKIFLFLFFILIITGCNKKKREYEIIDDNIYFGSYPQTLELEKKEELDNLIKKYPNDDNDKSWNSFNYYINGEIEAFMYYIDIDFDNDGNNDYRGIYFYKYRPQTTLEDSSIEKSRQDDNNYFINNLYWFKYEKIKWRILEDEKNSYMIMADLIIDSQDYYNLNGNAEFMHNGGVGYSNNYELSNIRKWLNDDFYNTAFKYSEKKILLKKEVDNSAKTTLSPKNPYYCNNTFDNVFLLSHQDALRKYFETDSDRQAIATDYAKCQGVMLGSNGNAYWRLRSPYINFVYYDTYINERGEIYNRNITNTCYGIRPVIWIDK